MLSYIVTGISQKPLMYSGVLNEEICGTYTEGNTEDNTDDKEDIVGMIVADQSDKTPVNDVVFEVSISRLLQHTSKDRNQFRFLAVCLITTQ